MMFAGMPRATDEKNVLLNRELMHGGGFYGSKERIMHIMSGNFSTDEKLKMIKSEYGTGGHSFDFPDGVGGFADHNSKGIQIRKYDEARTGYEFKWPELIRRIDNLIRTGEYMQPSGRGYNQFVIPPVLLGFSSPEARHASKMEEYRRVLVKAGAFTPGSKERIVEYHIQAAGWAIPYQENVEKEYQVGGGKGTIQLDADTVGYVTATEDAIVMRVGDPEAGPEIRQNWFSFAMEIQHEIQCNRYFTDKPIIYVPHISLAREENEDEELDIDQEIDGTEESDEPVEEDVQQDAVDLPQAAEQLYPVYNVDDTVYLESDRPFRITKIGEYDITLLDLKLTGWYPISRSIGIEEFESLLRRNELNADLFQRKSAAVEKEYDLGFGRLGNGITVYNRLDTTEDNDYRTVAHIADDGTVTLHEQGMPQVVIDQINAAAQRQTEVHQDAAAPLTVKDYEKLLDEHPKVYVANGSYHVDWTPGESGHSDEKSYEADRLISAYNKAVSDSIHPERAATAEQPNVVDIDVDKLTQELLAAGIDADSISEDAMQSIVSSPDFADTVHAMVVKERARQIKDSVSAQNYRITDESHIGEGGTKTKCHQNIEAIKLMKKLEVEDRHATPEEQHILARYTGWGGIPQVFDDARSEWATEYAELKEILTRDEYEAARATTLNAHYTATNVIKAMYTTLERAGVTKGSILEPAMGVGNFVGFMPESMSACRVTGVEIDSVTGRIAKQLYPKSDIRIQGFETATMPDNFYDVAISNVPFGNYQLADRRYDKNRFLIHDYFFAKALDKVRPGGVVAFITSKGTLDKANNSVRKYIAQRAELIGAVRLPNDAFKANAGTEVTTDIVFLKKRDRMMDVNENWLHVGQTPEGVPINEYYLDNPHMVLGTMAFDRSMYGNEQETTCNPFEGQDLTEALNKALLNINFEIAPPAEETLQEAVDQVESLPADPDVKNFTFTEIDGKLYYRTNSVMVPQDVSTLDAQRIRGLNEIRTTLRTLIDIQLAGCTDEQLKEVQDKLNSQYDAFVSKHGHFDSRAIKSAFHTDADYPLICSLEKENDNKEYEKADIFTKRTISQHVTVTAAETSVEALAVSLNEKGRLDLPFMSKLTGIEIDKITEDLKGIIYQNPAKWNGNAHDGWETADEYLSGNVRVKLREAELAAEKYPDVFAGNVAALKDAQPVDLTAAEIRVRLGASWIPASDVRDFVVQTLQPPFWAQNAIRVTYVPSHAQWVVEKANADSNSVNVRQTYGTWRADAYSIIEDTLNMKTVQIYDTEPDGTRIFNRKETIAAQEKQEKIKQAFEDFIFSDPRRRDRLVKKYNEEFNSVRLREFTGEHLTFPGMNPEIKLKQHQTAAVSRIIYGGNTLLAHVVGAGKTYEMIAAGMELKRMGIARKPIYVVPSHLVEQWGAEFMRLYPSANVLLATKKDFEKSKRQQFVSRIATGDYDAVIIGHSSFEKIPVSRERQERMIRDQINETVDAIEELKEARGQRVTIKFLEKTRKTLETELKRLVEGKAKDDVINFEQLGVDFMFVDEAHSFKNLYMTTKMNNIAGLSKSKAMKSTDMFNKGQYLQELNDGRGLVYATGTPISNSIVEMYTMQRYLQSRELNERGLGHFDAWASTFGETVSALELTPDSNGFRVKTRFAKFYNLPELTTMFKEVADIQTADMLKLPVPDVEGGKPTIVVTKPSEMLRAYIKDLGVRADRVRNRSVAPTEDNMLKITHDGRMAALDMRCIDPLFADEPGSKLNMAVENIHRIWQDTTENKSAQLVFSDISTPGEGKPFSAYTDIKAKLVAMGIPEKEIAFIHDFNTDKQKADLFESVRKGNVRVLIGSTFKMGAGTNVQDRLIALHHLDVPWRPSDIEQREGRIIRQGNKNKEVKIFRYVTEGSFDAYSWNLIEAKQKFIGQIMTGKAAVRNAEDIDGAALSYAEVKALATGNPAVKEKMEVDMEIAKLQVLQSAFKSQVFTLQDKVSMHIPESIRLAEEHLVNLRKDLETYNATPKNKDKDDFKIEIRGVQYTNKEDAGKALLIELTNITQSNNVTSIGRFNGFELKAERKHFGDDGIMLYMAGHSKRQNNMGQSITGNITRVENLYNGIPDAVKLTEERIETLHIELQTAKAELEKPFSHAERLEQLKARQVELNELLSMDNKVESVVVGEDEMQAVDGDEDQEQDIEQDEDDAPRSRRDKPEQER